MSLSEMYKGLVARNGARFNWGHAISVRWVRSVTKHKDGRIVLKVGQFCICKSR